MNAEEFMGIDDSVVLIDSFLRPTIANKVLGASCHVVPDTKEDRENTRRNYLLLQTIKMLDRSYVRPREQKVDKKNPYFPAT